MDFALTDTQRTLAEEVRRVAARFPLDYWREQDVQERYPWDFVRAFAELGWLGLIIPEAYGGTGLGMTEAGIVLHEICRSGAGTSGASAIHFYVFPISPVVRHGSEEMRSAYLPRVAAGNLLTAFGVTEPTAGSDTSRITTRAERRDGGWLVNGQKVWTTNAQNAEKILLLARTSPRDEAKPFAGMTLFFTDLDRQACTVQRIEKLGRAAVDSNEVFIDDLFVPDADVVGEVGRGFYHLLDGLNPERIMLALEAIGIGRAALDIATRYASERSVFGRPIGTNQAIAHPLARATAELDAVEMLALKAAWRYDRGEPCGTEATAAKVLAADAALNACDVSLQTLGGFGYAKEYHVERLWREVRLFKLAPISQELALNYLAHHALGLPRG